MKKNFDVFLPIDKVEKSGEGDEATYTISGMASTSDKDLQGETIDPQGINADYLLSDGWVDFEHDRDQVIGVPTENTYVDSKGLFLEAKLFKNMPQVQDIIKLYHNIKDNHIDRQLGFSIEGNVLERDASDDSIIRQVQITGVAVTKNPANTHATWELVSKSIFGLDNEEPTKDSDTTDSKPMLSMTVKLDKTNKALTAGHGITPSTQNDGGARKIGLRPVANSVADILAHKDSGDDVMILFLQLFEGLSYNDSQAVVHAINTNNLTTSRLERILSGADGITDD